MLELPDRFSRGIAVVKVAFDFVVALKRFVDGDDEDAATDPDNDFDGTVDAKFRVNED